VTEEQMNKIYAAGMQRGEVVGYQRGIADAQTMGPPQAKRGPSIEIADDLDWIQKVLEAASKAETAGHLDTFEIDFSNSQRARIQRFGRGTYISQKVFDCLKRLEKSLRRRGYL
jgi:hypothetical protein